VTLTELRYIVALARERHFGHAAAACFVSQPTLSVAVRKLEDELGVPLFERGSNEVALTEVGRAIVEQAQRVLEEADAIKRLAREGADQLSGSLRVGFIYTVGPYLLPHVVPAMHETAPNMPLRIEEGYTAQLVDKLKQGDVDVVVLSLPCAQPGVVTQPLYDEPFVVVLPAAHPWIERSEIAVEDLASENLLLLGPGHCFRDQILAACPDCQQASQRPESAWTAGSLETIRHMVASGLGITVLPCTAAGVDRYATRLLAIRRFAGLQPVRRVGLAWRKSYPRPRAIEALRQAISKAPLSCVHWFPDTPG
jgi:LysR family hydrogen peroxide-inducible transcriptional activator